MFRKYYKEANDDIKASEKFLNSVIENAHKQQAFSPVKKYRQYAASLAAAAIIVSGAVISMPLLSDKQSDGVITDETVTLTACPRTDKTDTKQTNEDNENMSAPDDDNTNVPPASYESTSKHSYNNYSASKPSIAKNARLTPAKADTPTQKANGTDEIQAKQIKDTDHGSIEDAAAQNNVIESTVTANGVLQEHNTEDSGASDITGNNHTAETGGAAAEKKALVQIVEDTAESDPETAQKSPNNASLYSSPVADSAEDIANAEKVDIGTFYDSDVPVPRGYRCERAAWNGYTFTSEDGAVIIVEISYGGEDSEPYYSVNGDNIYASFCSHNMSVTVSASGADISVVEEIVNSLR